MIRRAAEDVTLALTFMTRLPLPCGWIRRERKLAEALWAMPLGGVFAGMLGGGLMFAANLAGLPADLSGILAVAAMTLATGALHEDGLADFCDGLGGGRSVPQRLTIMREAQIGSYGAISLILALVSLIVLMKELFVSLSFGHFFAALIAAAAVSRCASAAIFALLRPARSDGIAIFFGHPGNFNIALTLIWPSLAAVVMLGIEQAIALLSGALLAALTIAALAQRYLGGYTGDVLGACISASFIAALLAIRLTL